MNVSNMRAYVKHRYANLRAKGGGLIPTEKASDAQIIAVYYQLSSREAKKKMTWKQLAWKF